MRSEIAFDPDHVKIRANSGEAAGFSRRQRHAQATSCWHFNPAVCSSSSTMYQLQSTAST